MNLRIILSLLLSLLGTPALAEDAARSRPSYLVQLRVAAERPDAITTGFSATTTPDEGLSVRVLEGEPAFLSFTETRPELEGVLYPAPGLPVGGVAMGEQRAERGAWVRVHRDGESLVVELDARREAFSDTYGPGVSGSRVATTVAVEPGVWTGIARNGVVPATGRGHRYGTQAAQSQAVWVRVDR